MIKIKEKEYKLKITLGFYKRLSFAQSDLETIHDNALRRFEVLKLALFFGNKQERGWSSIADMEKEISDDDLEMLDDNNIIEKISKAVYDYLPDSTKEALKEEEEDIKKK